jgi:hypothetical protein
MQDGWLDIKTSSSVVGSRYLYGATVYGRAFANVTGFNLDTGSAAVPLVFGTNGSERMRITDTGALLVGKTSTFAQNFRAVIESDSALTSIPLCVSDQRSGSTSSQCLAFYRTGVGVGNVTTTDVATSYNTSSDYRLKNVDGPITNSGAYIDALKPVQGSWKASGSRFIGLLAHEVQEVSETPIATGEKDGEQMQAMDYSAPELIANLIAEIQSLRARVAQLEERK